MDKGELRLTHFTSPGKIGRPGDNVGLLDIKVLPAGTGVSEESTGQGGPKQIRCLQKQGLQASCYNRTGSIGRVAQIGSALGQGKCFGLTLGIKLNETWTNIFSF